MFVLHDYGSLVIPFAAVPLEESQRIRSLYIGGDLEKEVPAGVLLALLQRLPGLESLKLWTDDPSPDNHLLPLALSKLPALSELRLGTFGYISSIPSSLAGQLTHLEVDARMHPGVPPIDDLTQLLSTMTALRKLDLTADLVEDEFSAADLLKVLDALPPSVEELVLWKVEPVGTRVRCFMEGGRLKAVRFSERDEGGTGMSYGALSTILTTSLLPSNKMGPRLGRLEIHDDVSLGSGDPPVPDPAADFLNRCDAVEVDTMTSRVPSAQRLLAAARLLGVPAALASGWSGPRLTLKPPPGDGDDDGSSTKGPGARLSAVAPPEALCARVLQCMAAEPTPRHYIVLRGPPLRSLLAVPAALKAWLEQLRADLRAAQSTQVIQRDCLALPSAGAVVLSVESTGLEEWGSPRWLAAGLEALGCAARRLVASGGGSSEPTIEAWPSSLSWEEGLFQALEALWNGEECSGSGASGDATAPHSGGSTGSGSELDSLRCLLESWEALHASVQTCRLDTAT